MHRAKSLVVTIGLGLVLVACGGGGPDPGDAAPTTSLSCSGAAIAVTVADQPGLPPAAAEARRQIARAAGACDYDRLQALALAGGSGFRWTLGMGAADEAARVWRQKEDAGDRILATLVQLLELPFATAGSSYVWPSAAGPNSTDEDWAAVERLHTRAEIAAMRGAGAYAGYRVGISTAGRWLFFLRGD